MEQPKKPKASYMKFITEMGKRADVKALSQEARNAFCSGAWKALSQAEKTAYSESFAEDLQAYKLALNAYEAKIEAGVQAKLAAYRAREEAARPPVEPVPIKHVSAHALFSASQRADGSKPSMQEIATRWKAAQAAAQAAGEPVPFEKEARERNAAIDAENEVCFTIW